MRVMTAENYSGLVRSEGKGRRSTPRKGPETGGGFGHEET